MEASDKNYDARVRESFDQQALMKTLKAKISKLEPGHCEIMMPYAKEITQQNGYIHAGAIASIADSAAGYAALSLAPSGSSVLTTEYKINLVSPAKGDKFLASARVQKSGKTLTVVLCEAYTIENEARKLCAILLATIMTLGE